MMMKPKLHITDLAVLALIAVPLIYLYIVYASLPEKVATHFNISGQPDAMDDKSGLMLGISTLSGVSILMYLFLRFLPVIDPKKTAKYSAGVFNKIAVALVLLLVCINLFIINAAQTGQFRFIKALPVIMGVFFIFMGNILHSIKPNYFAGIRTPWTLESEETWRKTHQLGGKIWFAGGFVIVVTGLAIPSPYNTYVMMGLLFIMAIIPIVYSYIYYQSIQKKANQ
jgi:uncharacterized membrane protein